MAATPHLPLIQTRDPLPSRTIWRTTDAAPQETARMCFDHDSRPPIKPIAGGSLDAQEVVLEDGDRSGD